MPFFGGGGGGDYKIKGTNIEGGTLAIPAIIGDNNMALGNGAMQNALNADRSISIGNASSNKSENITDNVIIGYSSAFNNINGSNIVVIGSQAAQNVPNITETVIVGGSKLLVDISNAVCIGPYSNFDTIYNSTVIGNVGRTSGSSANDCVIIGQYDSDSSSPSSCIGIGTGLFNKYPGLNSISIGLNTISGNNSIYLGNSLGFPAPLDDSIIIGNSSHTNIKIGGIDFSGGPGGGGIENSRTGQYLANWPDASFSVIGLNAATTVGTLGTGLTGSPWDLINPIRLTSAAGTGSSSQYYQGGSPIRVNIGTDFDCVFTFTPFDTVTTSRTFVGLVSLAGAIGNVDPSSLTNIIGVGADSADTNLQLMHNDGTGVAAKIDLGASFPKNLVGGECYKMIIKGNAGNTTYSVSVTELFTGATFSTDIATDIPIAATHAHFFRNNGATATAVVIGIGEFSITKYFSGR